MNDIDKLIENFKSKDTQKTIELSQVAATYIYDEFFAQSLTPVYANSIEVPIKKNANIILTSVSPNGEHQVVENAKEYMITIQIPRFPLENQLTASDINQFKTFTTSSDKTEAIAQKLGSIIKSHKGHFKTTLEYMAAGALFGKITDGEGTVLYEIENKTTEIVFKDTKAVIDCINEAEDSLSEELGYIPKYTILCSRGFVNKLTAMANTEKLFDTKEAMWASVDKQRILIVHGTEFITYSAKYKNADDEMISYIEDNKAILVPYSEDIYKVYYTNANHTDALGKKPTQFFTAAPEKLDKGKGYTVVSEMKSIPICVRPSALIRLKAE